MKAALPFALAALFWPALALAQVGTASTASTATVAPAAPPPPPVVVVAPPPPPPPPQPPPPEFPPVPVDAVVGPPAPPDAGVAPEDAGVEDAAVDAGQPAPQADAGVTPDAGVAATADAGVAPAVSIPAPPPILPTAPKTAAERRTSEILITLLLLAAVLLTGVSAALIRRYLDPGGLLPRLLGSVVSIARGVGVAAVLITPLLLLGYLNALGPWILLAALVLVGARDLVPDLVAFLVLRGERAVRPGWRLNAPSVSGRVQQVGLRSTRLVDEAGRVVTVPNHLLLQGPVRAEARGWPTREVELTLPRGDGAAQRLAILDAVRMCPWVPSEAEVSVRQDAANPERWLVRAEVVDALFAERFAGELAERVAEALAAASASVRQQ
ncbi:MAG: mechanosensitive ion channel [Deltaproteobacteria bacterium]|nr:mechanosensitive ion channel [Deltaproteobacteria bacterium]